MNKLLQKCVLLPILCLGLLGCKTTPKPVPTTEGATMTNLQNAAEHIDRDIKDIRSDADAIVKEAVNANKQLDEVYETIPSELKPNVDSAMDSIAEIKGHGNQIVEATERIGEETQKLEIVTQEVKDLGTRIEELKSIETQARANAMEKLYGYITLFWVIGFIVIAGGAVLGFFVNRSLGLMVMMVGAIMIGFASASQYYLKEVALVGGILLAGLVIGGLGFMVWGLISAKRNSIAVKEITEMIEILKETMTDGERERIFGSDGVASRVQSDLTREIVAKIKEKNGFKKLEEERNLARSKAQPKKADASKKL